MVATELQLDPEQVPSGVGMSVMRVSGALFAPVERVLVTVRISAIAPASQMLT